MHANSTMEPTKALRVTLDNARTTATAAATMYTLVSPTTSPAMDIAIWRTELPAGSAGPRHAIDRDQFLVVVSGTMAVEIDGSAYEVGAGDGILLPAGAVRVLAAAGSEPAATLTVGQAGAHATVGGGAPVAVPWAA
jgi:quercetin dioxygenase-like cupin family protein